MTDRASELADKILHNSERVIDHPDDTKALAALYCEVHDLRKNPAFHDKVQNALDEKGAKWYSALNPWDHSTSVQLDAVLDDYQGLSIHKDGQAVLVVNPSQSSDYMKVLQQNRTGLIGWEVSHDDMFPELELELGHYSGEPDCSPKPKPKK